MNIQNTLQLLFILSVRGQEDLPISLSKSLNRLIEKISLVNEDCLILVLDLRRDEETLRSSFENLQESSRVMAYQNNLRDWKDFVMNMRSKFCVQTVFFGSKTELATFAEEIFERALINHPYQYFIFLNDLSVAQGHIDLLLDIIYVTIILTTPKLGLLAAYQINPYVDGNKLLLSNIWSIQKSNFAKKFDFVDNHGDLKDRTLTVAYMLHPPYTIAESPEVISGFEQSVIAHVAQSLNFRTSFVESIDCNWGAVDENGSWNGIIGMVQRGESDMAMGALTRNFEREIAIDYTLGYAEQFLSFLTHVPSELPKWSSILWPFEAYVWYMIIITMVLFCVCYIVILKLVNRDKTIRISVETTNIWGSFFNQGITHPKRNSLKIILGTWFLCSFCIVASYGGSLISFLTLSNKEKPIDSLAELVKSDRKVIIVGGTFYGSLFEFAEDAVYRGVWDKMESTASEGISCSSNMDCLQKVNDNKKYTYIMDGDSFQKFYFKKNGLNDLYISKAKFFSSEYAIALRKNSPILKRFNEKTQIFLEMGLLPKWKDMFSKVYLSIGETKEVDKQTTEEGTSQRPAISLNHLQGVFLVAALGLSLSGLTFIWEMVSNLGKYKK